MLVHNFLEKSATTFPDKDAVWYNNSWYSFSKINQLANKVAHHLISEGIKIGDRVALLYENSHDYVISYYAILKAGATTVALNTDANRDSLTYLLNDCGAKAIISNKRFTRHLLPSLPKCPSLSKVVINQDDISGYQEIGHCDTARLGDIYALDHSSDPLLNVIDLDLASIVYTSGSTGKPKGVVLTHLNIVANTRSIATYLELVAKDRIMAVLPFYYIYGKSLLNTHFFVGGSVVIDNRFAFPNVVLEMMKKMKVTGFSGVPSTFMILLNKSTLKNYLFETLRYVTQAGGAMSASIQKEISSVFSPAKLFIMYGATEASARLSYLPPEWLEKKWGSIGKAIPNVRLFIGDENSVEKKQGEVGEIIARGSNLMQGYWNDKNETEQVLKNGYYFTGDLGKEDKDGFLYVVGRKKNMIKVGGERISPKEIEEKIIEINEIHETAVIGVEDDLLGEAIKAYIVPRENVKLDLAVIKKELLKKLPPIKQPKYLEIIKELPKNESGKVLKSKLEKN